MTIDVSGLRLPDEAFWQSGVNRATDPMVRKFRRSYFGVLIDAPREVPLPTRSTLPLFLYYMGTNQQVATRGFPDGAVLVVMDPDHNELRLSAAVPKDGERVRAGGPVPGEETLEGNVLKAIELDVRGRARLPWQPGRFITQVLLTDLASNRVETKLTSGPVEFVDIEKVKFLAAERLRSNPPAPFPLLPSSAYVAGEDSPAIPDGFGISLAAPRVAVLGGKEQLMLRGRWRLPLFPEELVKAANADYNKAHHLSQLAGCVGIHLVVVGSGQNHPFHYLLRLPVTQLLEGTDQPSAAGAFRIDLTQLVDFPQSDQTIFVYAYAKDWASEPATIGLVDRIPRY